MKDEGAVLVQYVFLDIVSFTQGRTVEAQLDIVAAVNRITLEALAAADVHEPDRILLPTGDGLAVALLAPRRFDIALLLAQEILQRVHSYNEATSDAKRNFQIRIGINQNIDNIIIDINGRPNIAGRGINIAHRIMDNADGGQILVGSAVHDILCEREAYSSSFRSLRGSDKHGNSIPLHQYMREDADWMNSEPPKRFQPKQTIVPITKYEVFVVAHAVALRGFFLERRIESLFSYHSAIMLHYLALESIQNSSKSILAEKDTKLPRGENGDMEDAWLALRNSFFWLKADLLSAIYERLPRANRWFEKGDYRNLLAFPTQSGVTEAKTASPEAWRAVIGDSEADPAEFNLEREIADAMEREKTAKSLAASQPSSPQGLRPLTRTRRTKA